MAAKMRLKERLPCRMKMAGMGATTQSGPDEQGASLRRKGIGNGQHLRGEV